MLNFAIFDHVAVRQRQAIKPVINFEDFAIALLDVKESWTRAVTFKGDMERS